MRVLAGDVIFFTLITSVRVPSCEGRIDFSKQHNADPKDDRGGSAIQPTFARLFLGFTDIWVYLPLFAFVFASAFTLIFPPAFGEKLKLNPAHRIGRRKMKTGLRFLKIERKYLAQRVDDAA